MQCVEKRALLLSLYLSLCVHLNFNKYLKCTCTMYMASQPEILSEFISYIFSSTIHIPFSFALNLSSFSRTQFFFSSHLPLFALLLMQFFLYSFFCFHSCGSMYYAKRKTHARTRGESMTEKENEIMHLCLFKKKKKKKRKDNITSWMRSLSLSRCTRFKQRMAHVNLVALYTASI